MADPISSEELLKAWGCGFIRFAGGEMARRLRKLRERLGSLMAASDGLRAAHHEGSREQWEEAVFEYLKVENSLSEIIEGRE